MTLQERRRTAGARVSMRRDGFLERRPRALVLAAVCQERRVPGLGLGLGLGFGLGLRLGLEFGFGFGLRFGLGLGLGLGLG